VIEQISPDTGTTSYGYDLAGNLVQSVDAAGVMTLYAYDALDRLISISYPGDPAENVAYNYDEASGGFGVGRLTSVADAVGTLAYVYDERGNVLSETRNHRATTLQTAYQYDAADRIAAITYPSGWNVGYSRDVMGRVAAVSATSPAGDLLSVASGFAFQPFGPITALTYGNGIAETRAFDLDYRLTDLAAGGAVALQGLNYHYDAADNVRSIGDAVTPHDSQRLSYDQLDRLIRARGAYGFLTYTYDAVGNRLTQTVTGGQGTTEEDFAYAPHSNRLTQISSGGNTIRSLAYGASGNLILDQQTSTTLALSYNQAKRLSGVTKSDGTLARYLYDGFGRRVVKAVSPPGNKTLFQYDQAGDLLEAGAGTSGRLLTDYIYLDGRPIALVSANSGNLDFIHDDRLGTPQFVTDGGQNVVWRAVYQPFGVQEVVAAGVNLPLRFPGQLRDQETGYYQNGFRDYDPSLGRYLESDPIGLGGGLNTYVYGEVNPYSVTDSLGLQGFALGAEVDEYNDFQEVSQKSQNALDNGCSTSYVSQYWHDYGEQLKRKAFTEFALDSAGSILQFATLFPGLGIGGGIGVVEGGPTLLAAKAAANLAQQGRTSGVAAALEIDGKIITAVSQEVKAHAQDVAQILNTQSKIINKFNGACGEPGCITKAYDALKSFYRAQITAVRIRKLGNPNHATVYPPCPSCRDLLRQLPIRAIRPIPLVYNLPRIIAEEYQQLFGGKDSSARPPLN
jgi:RHS repeat-associated protein